MDKNEENTDIADAMSIVIVWVYMTAVPQKANPAMEIVNEMLSA